MVTASTFILYSLGTSAVTLLLIFVWAKMRSVKTPLKIAAVGTMALFWALIAIALIL